MYRFSKSMHRRSRRVAPAASGWLRACALRPWRGSSTAQSANPREPPLRRLPATRSPSELAAARRVGERLHRNRAELVVVAFDLAQVHVLHRVAGSGERELATR